MSIEIEPFSGKKAHIEMSVTPAKGVKVQKTKPNNIPLGYDAKVRIGPDHYEVHEYRERPGHTPGAKIMEIRKDGTGAEVDLGPGNRINAINLNLFIWKPK